MGMPALPLVLTLMAAVPAVPAAPAAPMAEPEFQQLLLEGDLTALEQACRDALDFRLDQRLQQLRDRLLGLHPTPETLELVLANAGALMTCRSPQSAGVVLNRYSPGQGDEWRPWLLLRWHRWWHRWWRSECGYRRQQHGERRDEAHRYQCFRQVFP